MDSIHPSIHPSMKIKKKTPTIDIHIHTPMELYEKIESFCEINKYNTSEGIKELLQVGLFLSARLSEIKEKIKNPELLEEIHNQLKEGGLVDFVQRMNAKDFELISSIFDTEKKARKI